MLQSISKMDRYHILPAQESHGLVLECILHHNLAVRKKVRHFSAWRLIRFLDFFFCGDAKIVFFFFVNLSNNICIWRDLQLTQIIQNKFICLSDIAYAAFALSVHWQLVYLDRTIPKTNLNKKHNC